MNFRETEIVKKKKEREKNEPTFFSRMNLVLIFLF